MGMFETFGQSAGQQYRKALNPSDVSATFEVNLQPGPTRLDTWLKDTAAGRERGAYHVSAGWVAPLNPDATRQR